MANIFSKEVPFLILTLLFLDTLMAHAYEQKKDADGFLYITYTEESTLGALTA